MGDKDIRIPLEVIIEPEPEEKRLYQRFHYIADMTPEAAAAAKEVAKYQSAVPARNRTYQVIAGATAVVIICRWAIDALKADSASLASVLRVAVGGLCAVFVARQLTKKKKG